MKHVKVLLAFLGIPLGGWLAANAYSQQALSSSINSAILIIGFILAGLCATYLIKVYIYRHIDED